MCRMYFVHVCVCLAMIVVGCSKEPRHKRENGKRPIDVSDLDEVISRGDYRKKTALIIGVNDYGQGFKDLNFAVNDAMAFGNLLKRDFGYNSENVRMLIGDRATKDTVLTALNDWMSSLRLARGDSVLLFFAGHGDKGRLAVSDSDVDEPESWLLIDEIKNSIARLKCDHRLIILDCCFAGRLFSKERAAVAVERQTTRVANGHTAAVRSAGGQVLLSGRDSMAYYLTGPAYVGLAASREQPAVDGFGEGRHSVFTSALLKVMEERAYSTRSDRAFTFRQLAPLVESSVAGRLGDQQIPDWGYVEQGDGDFVFVPVRRNTIKVTVKLADGYELDWLTTARRYKADNLQRPISVELETAGRYYFRLRNNDQNVVGFGELTLGGEEVRLFKTKLRRNELPAVIRKQELSALQNGKFVELVAVALPTHFEGDLVWNTSVAERITDSVVKESLVEGHVIATVRLSGDDPLANGALSGAAVSPEGDAIARFQGPLLTKDEALLRDAQNLFLSIEQWSAELLFMASVGRADEALELLREGEADIDSQAAPHRHEDAIRVLRHKAKFVHRMRGGPDYQKLLKLVSLLNEYAGGVDAIDTPFNEFVDWLNADLDVEFDVAWTELGRVGLSMDEPITVHPGRDGFETLESLLLNLWKEYGLSYAYDGRSRITIIPGPSLQSPLDIVPIKYYVKDILEGRYGQEFRAQDLKRMLGAALDSLPGMTNRENDYLEIDDTSGIMMVGQSWPGHVLVLDQLLELSGLSRDELVYSYDLSQEVLTRPERVKSNQE